MLLKINVDAACISRGVRGNACCCPVAEAITSQYSDLFMDVEVTTHYVVLRGEEANKRWEAELPPDVVDKIEQFDVHGIMEPFEFEIDVKESAA